MNINTPRHEPPRPAHDQRLVTIPTVRPDLRSRHLALICAIAVAIAAAFLMVWPQGARAATLVSPTAGQHLEWTMLRPTVAFDLAEKEQPKWVLLASDQGMTQTLRYCRQFTAVIFEDTQHLGCNVWATGVDAYGRDIVRNLEWGKTYYWQLVFTDVAGAEAKTEARAFAINNEPVTPGVGELSDKIFGQTFGDGTELNLGAAAFVNSALRVGKASSQRRSKNRFWINVKFEGGADLTTSYVRIKSKAGTRYVRLAATGTTSARATWVRSATERRLRPGRYEYQVFLKSAKNGSVVRSASRVIVVQTKGRRATRPVPSWTRF